jgi:perosamine synthetase
MIPISKPWMDEAEWQAARRPIASGWVLQGPEVQAFENEFAAYTGAPFAVAVSSGTAALHLALLAAGVTAGDEVITVSHSFIATANCIRFCSATPVFVDIQADTFNLDPAQLEAAVSERTRAILCVHQLGMPCDLPSIREFARPRGIAVIEDAACAAGSEIQIGGRWERIGKPHADLACFSFHPRKLLSTGDGGMITCSRADFDARLRLLRNHGISTSPETNTIVGYNYRLTDIQAAIGREQLRRLPQMLERRREQAQRYRELLSAIPDVTLPLEPAWARSNWQSYCVRLAGGISQRAVMQAMREENVSTRPGVQCAHREPAYADRSTWRAAGALRNGEQAQDQGLILPLFHDLTASQQEHVAAALGRALRRQPASELCRS